MQHARILSYCLYRLSRARVRFGSLPGYYIHFKMSQSQPARNSKLLDGPGIYRKRKGGGVRCQDTQNRDSDHFICFPGQKKKKSARWVTIHDAKIRDALQFEGGGIPDLEYSTRLQTPARINKVRVSFADAAANGPDSNKHGNKIPSEACDLPGICSFPKFSFIKGWNA